MEQGTEEWHAARCGKVTASRIADVCARTKSGWGASRANYMAQLIAERLTGTVAESFTSKAMEWGTDTEAEARNAYAFIHSVDVELVGFVDHPIIGSSGASPDGLVGNSGLVEIKCPNTATHIDTLLSGKIPGKYVKQMLGQTACTDRQWCDFVSYDPRMPEHMRMFVQRLARCEQTMAGIVEDVVTFQSELSEKLAALTSQYPELEAA